jgi:thiamine biosynthesis lipoprotein
MTSHRFRAMGTDIELLVEAERPDRALAAAEAEFHRLEALLSRFLPDSELSQLNERGSLEAGPDLLEVVRRGIEARRQTGGRFDLTVHDAVVAAGYDRTFDELPAEGPAPTGGSRCGGGARVDGNRIELDEGVRLDLGGIGKGYAAENAATILAVAGPCLVNAGGDVAARGGSWPIGVETADGALTLELSTGGLATSGRDRRVWRRAGKELHHLIDPATGLPAAGDLLRATVVAPDAIQAEVWAKALFLAGSHAAASEADAHGLPCVLVTEAGETRLAGGLG